MDGFSAFSSNTSLAGCSRFWTDGSHALSCQPLLELGMGFVSSTRACGDMRLSGADGAAETRARFVRSFAPGRPFVCARQVHGDSIVLLSGAREEIYDERDGFLVPRSLDLAAGVFTADCLAICLYDSRTRDFALLHSGWRGSHAGITGKALAMLYARGSLPADIHIACSPSIHACCYQVGPEFAEYFPKASLMERDGHLYFDNQGSVLAACMESGVLPEHIYPSPHCTACFGARFFSHRRAGPGAGRMLTLAYRL